MTKKNTYPIHTEYTYITGEFRTGINRLVANVMDSICRLEAVFKYIHSMCSALVYNILGISFKNPVNFSLFDTLTIDARAHAFRRLLKNQLFFSFTNSYFQFKTIGCVLLFTKHPSTDCLLFCCDTLRSVLFSFISMLPNDFQFDQIGYCVRRARATPEKFLHLTKYRFYFIFLLHFFFFHIDVEYEWVWFCTVYNFMPHDTYKIYISSVTTSF